MTDLAARLQAALGEAYRIERELGGGGMSRVFVAEELALGRKVVVKVLPPEMGAGVNAERFRREIQLAASLQHPHIVPVHTAGHSGDLFYYTMPLVEGESLRDMLAREGRLPVARVVRLMTDVVGALAYAHRQGIVHRDIKPDNVLISHQHAMVTDFGVAKAVSEALPHGTLTSAGMAVGTPGYMAPEQAAGDPNVDHRCDLYAVGTLAYEMLTGRPAFWGHSPQSVLARQLTEDPPPLQQHLPDAPPALASAVMRCLAREPEQRWQTADQLLAALEAVITPSGTPTAASLPGTARAPRRWWLAGAVATALLVIAVLARLLLWPARAAASPTAIAVFPFTVRGGSEMAYLGEGIVNLLSTSLDGAGELRSVDPRGLLALVHREQLTAPDPASASRLASRLNAGLFVLGDIVQAGERLRLEAALYDPRRGEAATGRAVVDGAPAEVFSLVDRLAAQLLAQVGGGRESRVTQVAAVTTASLPALKAYLEGEAEFRAGRFQPALEAFQRAVAADSQFALAFYRLSIAAEWALRPEIAREAAVRAVRYATRLSERDRRLLEALQLARGVDPERSAELFGSIVAQYPEDVDAWQQLGEVRFHYGPLLGHALPDAREPWERLASFEPDNVTAMLHLARIEASVGNGRALDSLVRRILSLNPSGERVLEMEVLRAVGADGAAQLSRVLGLLRGAGDLMLPQAVFSGAIWGGDAEAVRSVMGVMVEPGRSVPVRALGHLWRAQLELAFGHWRLARTELAAAAALDPAAGLEQRSLIALTPFLPVGREELDSLRGVLARWSAAAVPQSDFAEGYFSVHNGLHPTLRTYLLGMIEARLGDATSAQARAAELDRASVSAAEAREIARPLTRSVRAEVLERQGHPEAALEALGGQDVNYEPALFSPFYSRALERWRRAAILDSLGRLDEAARWYRSFRDFSLFDRIYEAPAALRLGRIAERQGRREEARAAYQRVVALWGDCDPELRPLVEEARARLARL